MSKTTLDIENHEALRDYLRLREPSCEPTDIKTLAGGVSNRTVLVRFRDGSEWVIKQALAKLRTKADWFSDPARVHREALGMRWLGKLAPPETIPEFVFEDFDHHLLAMQAVMQPHENWKTRLMAGHVNIDLVEQFAALLAAIHRHAAESTEPLKQIFDDRSFFESLRLEPYYGFAATQVPEAADFLNQLIHDTRDRRLTLVHGDFSPKNILVREKKLVLLDHEVIHWGDPAFDLGFALTHLLSKFHHLQEPAFGKATLRFCEIYQSVVGPVYWDPDLEAITVRHTLGCLLARVAGRSPLEYLTTEQRARQREFAIAAMRRTLNNLTELFMVFEWTMRRHVSH